jgi:hypothetical protein
METHPHTQHKHTKTTTTVVAVLAARPQTSPKKGDTLAAAAAATPQHQQVMPGLDAPVKLLALRGVAAAPQKNKLHIDVSLDLHQRSE